MPEDSHPRDTLKFITDTFVLFHITKMSNNDIGGYVEPEILQSRDSI